MNPILLIEDSPGHGQDIAASLARRGYEVVRTAADSEAIAMANARKPSLVIADVARFDGKAVDVLETLGWVDAVPCILISEPPSLRCRHSLSSMPFLEFIFWRPYSKDGLLGALEDLLERHESRLQVSD